MPLNQNLSKLPEQCYTVPEYGSDLILIKRGEPGYYATTFSTESKAENRALANMLNAKLGVSKAEEHAMFFGSMFNWYLPGANPGFYAVTEHRGPAPAQEYADDERAYSLNGGEYYFLIQTYDEGYDYYIFFSNFFEFDGGQYDDTSINMEQAIQLILEDYDLHNLPRTECDIDELRTKTDEVAQARYEATRAKLSNANLETRLDKAKVRSTRQQSSAEKFHTQKEQARDE